jgi:hypothetical protein
MKSYRKELWFNIPTRRAFVNITPDVETCLRESGIREGLCLVNAMHITISVAQSKPLPVVCTTIPPCRPSLQPAHRTDRAWRVLWRDRDCLCPARHPPQIARPRLPMRPSNADYSVSL